MLSPALNSLGCPPWFDRAMETLSTESRNSRVILQWGGVTPESNVCLQLDLGQELMHFVLFNKVSNPLLGTGSILYMNHVKIVEKLIYS